MKARDQIKTRGLAGAVRSDQGYGFAFLHRKADVLHGAQSAEPLVETANDQRFGHGAAFAGRADDRAARRAASSERKPMIPVGRHRITAIRISA